MNGNRITDGDRVLLIERDGERYYFHFDVDDTRSRSACLRTIGRFASNPELSFNWADAASVSNLVRLMAIERRESGHAQT